MKFRVIKLGPGRIDRRHFGFQYIAAAKIFYLKLYFFALYLALGKYDIAADYERIIAEHNAALEAAKNNACLLCKRPLPRAILTIARFHKQCRKEGRRMLRKHAQAA